jgi:hypothetical protein
MNVDEFVARIKYEVENKTKWAMWKRLADENFKEVFGWRWTERRGVKENNEIRNCRITKCRKKYII